MIWLSVAFAAFLVCICLFRADQDFTDFQLRLTGRYSFDRLQRYCGIATQAELETRTGKPPGVDRLYALSRAEFNRLPRCRWVHGAHHPLLNLAAGVGLAVFFATLLRDAPDWRLYGLCAAYLSVCLVWDAAAFVVLGPDLDLARDALRAEEAEKLTVAIFRIVCGADDTNESDDLCGSLDAATTALSLLVYEELCDLEETKRDADVQINHPGNARSVKLLYRLSKALSIASHRRSLRKTKLDLDEVLRAIDGILGHAPEDLPPRESVNARLLRRVQVELDAQRQLILTSDDPTHRVRFDDLRRVKGSLAARVNAERK
jgi:hypothetical protein